MAGTFDPRPCEECEHPRFFVDALGMKLKCVKCGHVSEAKGKVEKTGTKPVEKVAEK